MLAERPMTESERRLLENMVHRRVSPARAGVMAYLIGPLAGSFLGLLLLMPPLAISGVIASIAGLDLRDSPAFIGCSIVYVSAWAIGFTVYSVRATRREQAARRDERPLIAGDLERGTVSIEDLSIAEALCFEEIEHHGLAYFLRTEDGRVLFVFDHDSQCPDDEARRRMQPDEFLPSRRLRIIRAPCSGIVFDRPFSGEKIPITKIHTLYDIEEMPEIDSYVDLPWEAVLERYGTPPQARRRGRRKKTSDSR